MKDIICWWSGGVTSAVACKLAIDVFGIENCRIVFISTNNEDEDTYRFKNDCEMWYGKKIESICNDKYATIQDVWYRFNSLNVAGGAICSSTLKRDVRKKFSTHNKFLYQVFGFDIDEPKRARAMKLNNGDINPIFPLLLFGYNKKDCIRIINKAGYDIPRVYDYGFNNNNCFNTGCVQGGVGYWKKIQREFPDKFNAMAKVEHELTDRKGQPVTCLKDQKQGDLVFLLPHPQYPLHKDISMMRGIEPEPLTECNGFCGTNDLIYNQ